MGQAWVCHRIASWIVVARRVRVTSCMRKRTSCCRSTWVVEGACQMVGRAETSARMRGCGSGLRSCGARCSPAVASRSSRATSASGSFHSRSRRRATSRCSGSTARQRRRARSAAYWARASRRCHLAFDLTGLGCQAVQSRQGNSQVGGLDGVEEGLGDGGVEAIPPQGVAGRGSKIDRRSGTGREGSDAIVQGAHPHPPPTLAAQHKALEEGGSLTDGAPLLFRPAGAIVRKARLIVEKLRPGQGAGVDIVEEHGPVLQGDSARPACDPGGATREETGPGGRPPIDRGARRRGGVEHRQDARVAQRLPADLAVRLLAPQAVRKAQVRRRELLDDREGRGLLLTEGKDELDSLLDLLVRIAHALAGGIEDEPTGGRKRRWPCAACCRLPPSRRLRRQ